MVTKNSCWKRKLSGKVWVVDRVYDNGPFEIEIRLPETGEREGVSRVYLENHFEFEPEQSQSPCFEMDRGGICLHSRTTRGPVLTASGWCEACFTGAQAHHPMCPKSGEFCGPGGS